MNDSKKDPCESRDKHHNDDIADIPAEIQAGETTHKKYILMSENEFSLYKKYIRRDEVAKQRNESNKQLNFKIQQLEADNSRLYQILLIEKDKRRDEMKSLLFSQSLFAYDSLGEKLKASLKALIIAIAILLIEITIEYNTSLISAIEKNHHLIFYSSFSTLLFLGLIWIFDIPNFLKIAQS